MLSQPSRYALGLAFIAGGLAIAPSAQAQIQVIGGDTSGQAAFFVPGETPEGNIRLFDVGIETLRIETPNGITTTSVFTPGAAGFTDADLSGTPNTGDTGVLSGTLSGLAFTANGTPVPFTGRPTLLNFTLSNYTTDIGSLTGTLIRSEVPGEASLLFLPGVNNDDLTLTTPGFVSDGGTLELGNFDASLNDGVIDLPSSLEFRDSAAGTVIPLATTFRRIKFDFEGENIVAGEGTEFDTSDENIRFVGETNRRFRIQSVGTQASSEFKIDGDLGAVDISLNGPFDADAEGIFDFTVPIDEYRIRGESEGFVSFYDLNTVGFGGIPRRETRFDFSQGENEFKGESAGNVSFFAVAGANTLVNDGIDFTNIDITLIDQTIGVGPTCTICGVTITENQVVRVGRTRVRAGHPAVVNNSQGNVNQQRSQVRFNITANIRIVSVSSSSSELFAVSGNSSTAVYQYNILTAPRYYILAFDNDALEDDDVDAILAQVRVRVVERGSDRYFVVVREQQVTRETETLVAYSQIGPGSRIFPGLVGLEEISDEDLAQFDDLDEDDSEDVDSEDVSDDLDTDDSEDVGDDLDDDLDTDDSEDVDDSSDDVDDSEDVSDDLDDDLETDDSVDDVEVDDSSDDSSDDIDDSEDVSDDLDDDLDTDDSVDDVEVDDSSDDTDDSDDGVEVDELNGIEGLEEIDTQN
ncbi:MAG: hypothetical protein WBA57_02165 [Elainellaceae cyanobacterium]